MKSCKPLLLLLLLGCSSQQESQNQLNADEPLGQWALWVNGGNDSLQYQYTENALKVRKNGSTLQGAEAISQELSNNNPPEIDSTWTDYSVAANDEYTYQIGGYRAGNAVYRHILIVRRDNQKRDFEFIVRAEETPNVQSEIDERRNTWIRLCNAHDSKQLVSQLYSPTPVYYNHKPPVTNPDSLAKEYSYMNLEKYNLHLRPLHVSPVSARLVYEIGQCSGSYNGKYLLVWQKDKTGKWKVLVDSNI